MNNFRLLPVLLSILMLSLPTGCDSSKNDSRDRADGQGSAERAEHDIVLGEGYGPVSFGMSKSDVIAAVGKPQRELGGRVMEYLDHGYAVVLDRGGRVEAILCGDGSGGGILVERFRGRTLKDIGMGSTPEAVVQAYGQPDKRKAPAGGHITLLYDTLGATFSFKDGRLVHMTFRVPRE